MLSVSPSASMKKTRASGSIPSAILSETTEAALIAFVSFPPSRTTFPGSSRVGAFGSLRIVFASRRVSEY